MLHVRGGANRENEIKEDHEDHEVHGVEVATVVVEDAIETVVVVDEENTVTSMEMIAVHNSIVMEIMAEIKEDHGDQQAVMMVGIGDKVHRADASY